MFLCEFSDRPWPELRPKTLAKENANRLFVGSRGHVVNVISLFQLK